MFYQMSRLFFGDHVVTKDSYRGIVDAAMVGGRKYRHGSFR